MWCCHKSKVSCQIFACFSVKLLTFQETSDWFRKVQSSNLGEKRKRFGTKQCLLTAAVYWVPYTFPVGVGCLVWLAMAWVCNICLVAVPQCSAQCCLQLGVLALLQFGN